MSRRDGMEVGIGGEKAESKQNSKVGVKDGFDP